MSSRKSLNKFRNLFHRITKWREDMKRSKKNSSIDRSKFRINPAQKNQMSQYSHSKTLLTNKINFATSCYPRLGSGWSLGKEDWSPNLKMLSKKIVHSSMKSWLLSKKSELGRMNWSSKREDVPKACKSYLSKSSSKDTSLLQIFRMTPGNSCMPQPTVFRRWSRKRSDRMKTIERSWRYQKLLLEVIYENTLK